MEKDHRRLFTVSQKQEILAAFGYKCQGQNCLDKDLANKPFEFHHIKPHSEFGSTERSNCIPLCIPCHQEYTKKKLALQVGPAYMQLREWQQDAMQVYTDHRDKVFVLEAAPGAGKSLFAATVASYELNSKDSDIEHVICIAPWVPILRSIRRSFNVYKLDARDGFHYDTSKGALQRQPHVPVTIDTYSGFCKSLTIDVLKRWMGDVCNPFRFMLVLDEVHHTKTHCGKWGPYLARIADMAEKVVVMSGTYFRNDSKPISFLEYQEDKPVTHFSISYTQCVMKRYTRQVSFRYHDPILTFFNNKRSKEVTLPLSRFPRTSEKLMSMAKNEVLDPTREHIAGMIKEAWIELQAMRKKWPDAACLVVCRAGKNESEEKSVFTVSKRIKQITGCDVETVVSDDATSRGRIDAFCDSKDPFICAVRMVSEGVDIPRVRMVLFLSFTDSEMLFRQIVGRAVRYIDGKEDDTAALVIMPKFPAMAEFADRFEGEAKTGFINIEPATETPRHEGYDANGICQKCNRDPCCCFVLLDSQGGFDGGLIAQSSVGEHYIQIAKRIRESSVAHQHSNPVQMADILQRGKSMDSEPVWITVEQERVTAWMGVERQVKTIARLIYGGDYKSAWVNEVHNRTGSDAKEIQSTWTVAEINGLCNQLKQRIIEGIQNV